MEMKHGESKWKVSQKLVHFIGEGHGNPLQYSCLENPMDRRAWWAVVHGVAESWTRPKCLSMSTVINTKK